MTDLITNLEHPAMDSFCKQLADESRTLGGTEDWPRRQLELCGEYGVFRWFMPERWEGFEWSEVDIVRGYLKLSEACLTTTFIITQRTGACRRIFDSQNEAIKPILLPSLANGQSFATVGISHLTTSHRHLDRPALRAIEQDVGFLLDGMTPWVTGAPFAEHFVVGATLDDGRQILIVVPATAQGLTVHPSQSLVALSASRTGRIDFDEVRVGKEWLLSGPVENVMSQGIGARTGGLQTSTLALGLTRAALSYLHEQVRRRPEIGENTEALEAQWQTVCDDLLRSAAGNPTCTNDELRVAANSLVLRASQSALMAAKGAGYVAGHPTGRWCREALFFLVWSCPQPVVSANLCELAGIQS